MLLRTIRINSRHTLLIFKWRQIMPKVSVVMCVYNHEKFVSESIKSVINQTYQDWEFIITNDGSTDRSLDIIKQYDDPRITLFSFDKNTGARVARNNSIKH